MLVLAGWLIGLKQTKRRLEVRDFDTTWKIKLEAKVVDEVTGFAGVVIGRSEYSTGCKQYCVMPKVNDKGELVNGEWFDEDRLVNDEVKSKETNGGPQQFPAPVK